MPVICPTITTSTPAAYRKQVDKVAHFASRIHIDLTDGIFAEPKTVSAAQAWWPAGIKADFHLMYKDPEDAARTVAKHHPHMIIVHAEASGNFEAFADFCHHHRIKVGVALLQKTTPEAIVPALDLLDHVLIFAGHLGHQDGGQADMHQLEKVELLKNINPQLEIGWDGGINDQNISRLASAGVDVFNVGGYIQKAENPQKAYNVLQRIADETGST